jgi:hypothetical protein
MNPYAIAAMVLGVVVLLVVLGVKAYGRSRANEGEAIADREQLEIDHGKQKRALEHLQGAPPRGSDLVARLRGRMRKPKGDPDPPVS